MKHDQKKPFKRPRNINQLLQDRGELDLSTRSVSLGKKRFSRKEKHKKSGDCWIEFFIFRRIESSNMLSSTMYFLKLLLLPLAHRTTHK